eukprot:NODE_7_length_67686_cov_1.621421.p10 type:complete len:448 gc:universal NODE_7_length_67686_cov_1.621421:57648-56305(-)
MHVKLQFDFDPGTEKYDFENGLQALAIKEGEEVEVVKGSTDWTLVKYKGKEGYVPSNYLEIKKALKPLELPVKTNQVADKQNEKEIKPKVAKIERPKMTLSRFTAAENTSRGTLKPYGTLKRLEPTQKTTYLKECATPTAANITFAIVVQYFKGKGNVWTFLIETDSKDHIHRIIYRTYQDFYDMQLTLLATFPQESGISGTRVIPTIPGPVPFANENVTQRRAAQLAVYCKEIFAQLPEHILNSQLIQNFFQNWEIDTVYNKKYQVKEGMSAAEIVAPWNQMKVGSGVAVSEPMKGKRNVPKDTKEVNKEAKEKPKEADSKEKTDKPREKKKEDPNELKAPTTFQNKPQKLAPKERKGSIDENKGSDEQVAEPVASPAKFDFSGKVFVMLLNNNTYKEAQLKITTKLNLKSIKMSYIDGTDVIEIGDEDDWQTYLQLTPKPKINLK